MLESLAWYFSIGVGLTLFTELLLITDSEPSDKKRRRKDKLIALLVLPGWAPALVALLSLGTLEWLTETFFPKYFPRK